LGRKAVGRGMLIIPPERPGAFNVVHARDETVR
jgi:hypothetical protein